MSSSVHTQRPLAARSAGVCFCFVLLAMSDSDYDSGEYSSEDGDYDSDALDVPAPQPAPRSPAGLGGPKLNLGQLPGDARNQDREDVGPSFDAVVEIVQGSSTSEHPLKLRLGDTVEYVKLFAQENFNIPYSRSQLFSSQGDVLPDPLSMTDIAVVRAAVQNGETPVRFVLRS